MTEAEIREKIRQVRDAGAIDDNMGAEDWSASDKAIEVAMSAIREYVEWVIGEDDDATWQKVWYGKGKVQEIDDPLVIAQNQLRAEMRGRLSN